MTKDDIEGALLTYGPTLNKKFEECLNDIRAGQTMALSEYKTTRVRKKAPKA